MTTALLIFVLHAFAGAHAGAQPPARPPQQNVPADYTVGPGDKLNIIVLNISEFSAQGVAVESDGAFEYLNFGRIRAQDKTPREIAAAVRALLIDKHQHNDPTVTVDVAEFRSQFVYVAGAVKNGGSFPITGNETLLSVLSRAGFTTSSGSYVEVTRNKPVPGTKVRFARKALESGAAPAFRLQDQDSIIVTEAEKCYVRGEVRTPGSYEVTENMTVLEAIISAGDFTERASKGGVTILRKDGSGKPQKIKVPKDLSMPVLPGDTIVVGRRIL